MDFDSFDEADARARRLYASGDISGAERFFRQAAQAAPRSAEAQYNLGVTLAALDRIEDALACYRRAIEIDPSYFDPHVNLGSCLVALNFIEEAHRSFEQAARLKPDHPAAAFNAAVTALALGDYERGWRGYGARWRLPHYAPFLRSFDKPLWRGEGLSGKTLFLYAEQGFGDTIQLARYLPMLAARAARVAVQAPSALTRLLRSARTPIQILNEKETPPAFDYACAMMDLPSALGVRLETLGETAVPYLFADMAETRTFLNAIPRRKGVKRIGLAWAGRGTHANDHNRSMDFAQLAPLLRLEEDVEWFGVQHVVSETDAALLAASPVVNCGPVFADFAAAAAAIMTMDLVITVDTAIAHLAGALGKPVWVLLPYSADWRWLTDRADSPWYPSARLFRQPSRNDWRGVIRQVAEEIARK